MLYAFGSNQCGQLGFESDDKSIPTPVDLPEGLKIVRISGGANHSLILTEDGLVYGSGDNTKFQLGLSEPCYSKFELIPQLKNVSFIQCGWESSFAIINGKVYGTGEASFGILGTDQPTETWIEIGSEMGPVTSVACGLRHTIFLCADGTLWGTGNGKYGALGSNVTDVVYTPQKLQMEDVVSVACGQFHTITLIIDGTLSAFGRNRFGQLCQDTQVKLSSDPLTFYPPEEIAELRSGWSTCASLSKHGTVHIWGRADKGQTGLPNLSTTSVCTPTLSETFKFKCLEFGSEHGLGIDFKGHVYTWGWNEHGNCGLGHEKNVFEPTQIPDLEHAVLVGAGGGHSFIYTWDD